MNRKLSVRNGKIVDATSGQRFRLKGANWFGCETDLFALHGLWSVSMGSVLDAMVRIGVNAIRFPFSAEFALGLDSIRCKNVNVGANPGLKDASAGQMLDAFCQACLDRDLLVMPDLHRMKSTDAICEMWYSDEYPEPKVIEAWLNIVRRCKRFPNVFAADIKNEPHGSCTWSQWKGAVERIGEAILAEKGDLLIVAEGVQVSADGDNCFWGGNLKDAAGNHIRLSVPNKLVYSPHTYGPDVAHQPYFSDGSFPNNMRDIWHKYFGYLASSHPIIVGEWGGKAKPGTPDLVWQKAFAAYLGESDLDAFYWCVNPNSGDTNGIMLEDWVTLDQTKVELMHTACPNPGPGNQVDDVTSDVTSDGMGDGMGINSDQDHVEVAKPYVEPEPEPIVAKPEPIVAELEPPTAETAPMTAGLSVAFKKVSEWYSGGESHYQIEAVVSNGDVDQNKAYKHALIRIQGTKSISQIWSVTKLGEANAYDFPDWITNHGGLRSGEKLTFGFICTSADAGKLAVSVSAS